MAVRTEKKVLVPAFYERSSVACRICSVGTFFSALYVMAGCEIWGSFSGGLLCGQNL